MKNIKTIASNPQQRNMIIFCGVIMVATLGTGLYYATKNETSNQPAGANVAAVPPVTAIPGTSNSPDYNKKVQEANEEQARKALESGGTFVPTLTGTNNIADISPLDLLDKQREAARRLKEEQEAKLAEEELKKIQEKERETTMPVPVTVVQVEPTPVVQAPVKKPKYTSEDYILISSLIGQQKARLPSSEFNFAGQQLEEKNFFDQNAQNTQNGMIQGQQASQNTADLKPLPIAKAGTILNAVLETAVNSDEPSPVLAKVVSGPLKDTRLIGSIQTVGKKVVLQFSTANMPKLANSIKISAVAVDPESSRTALASDVDNHYFARYGVLLASAFLSGWSNAIARQNTTTTVSDTGSVIVSQGELSSKDINRQAFGQVGNELANTARQNVNEIKPTITVDGGIAIGILLMDDLVITTK